MRNPWAQGEWTGDWSDKSDLWTDELREQLDIKDTDDGVFHMTWADYLTQFSTTCICIKTDDDAYTKSTHLHDFSEDKLAYFSIELENAVDCENEIFSIGCIQQGDRLKKWRSRNDEEKWWPSEFGILLMTAGGEWVAGIHGGASNMNFSLLLQDEQLEPGQYIICVDPTWNESSETHEDFKKVLIDIYCSQTLTIEPIEESIGFECLEKSLKHVAQNVLPETRRQFYLQDEGMEEVYRITDSGLGAGAWFGFIYTNNGSEKRLEEDLTVEVEGLELHGRDDYTVDIEEFTDDIIIWRRTAHEVSHQISANVKPSEKSFDDLKAQVEQCEPKNLTGDIVV